MKLGIPWRREKKEGRVGIGLGREGISVVYRNPQGLISVCQYLAGDTPAKQDAALRALVEEHQLEGAACSVVLSSAEYQVLLVEVPSVSPEELRSALGWRIKDQLKYPINEAVIDYFLLPDDAYRGRQKMAYVAVMRKEALEADVQRFEDDGLTLDDVSIMELAINNVSSQLPVDSGSCATLSLGRRHGFINMSINGDVYLSRGIDTGWDALLYEGLNGLSRGIDNPELNKLLLQLQRSLDYYESQLGKGVVTTLYLNPAGEQGELLVDFLRENLVLTVEMIDTANILAFDAAITSEQRRKCFPAIGAVLSGIR